MALYFKVNSSLNSTVDIYVNNTVTIDWGDGTPLEVRTGSINHTYSTPSLHCNIIVNTN